MEYLPNGGQVLNIQYQYFDIMGGYVAFEFDQIRMEKKEI